jgi:hypothetical protein
MRTYCSIASLQAGNAAPVRGFAPVTFPNHNKLFSLPTLERFRLLGYLYARLLSNLCRVPMDRKLGYCFATVRYSPIWRDSWA